MPGVRPVIAACPARIAAAPCREHPNPRYKDGCCWHCHRDLSLSRTPRRNLILEEQVVRHACRGVLHDPGVLEHSQTRAKALSGQYVSDPMEIRPDLNRDLEGREEAADGVNHVLFQLQCHLDCPGDEHRLMAIRYFALAWDELKKAENAGR